MSAVTLTGTPVLHTARLRLRAPQARDWPAWRAFALSRRAALMGPFDAFSAWHAFGHAIGHWVLRGYGWFALTRRDEDEAIGLAGPWQPETWPEPEIGWALFDRADEGRGLAAEAVAAIRDFAFRTLGWTTAVSYIDPANARSIALARRLGARLDPAAPRLPAARAAQVWRHPAPEAAR